MADDLDSLKSPAPSPSGAPKTKTILLVVFVTLFLDLIGFSIIFPLFPGMLDYYRTVEGDSGLFGLVYSLLQSLTELTGAPQSDWGLVVLFGGVLGSLYSLLQFLGAPLFGALSDRVGRKPVLLLSIFGIFVSYVLWFFAGSFSFLVASRLLGGLMGANLSTATAVVADVTTEQNRTKGMAIVGMAFGLGFILGPALGGIMSLIDISALYPALADYGVNPWSMAAGLAAVLSLLNLVLVGLLLPETRPENAKPLMRRSNNPFKLFHVEKFPGVSRTNLSYFFFILAFSGMEFTLTFVAVEHMGFTPQGNAMMFVFVGLVLALMQGGYVRRQSGKIGTRRMAMHGLYASIPGLVFIGAVGLWANIWVLYLGLFCIAVGSAQVNPCLTSLVSVYTPPEEQGRIMGVFRSLGALGRVVGPLVACVMYWRLGAPAAYFLGAVSLIIPVMIARRLPEPAHS